MRDAFKLCPSHLVSVRYKNELNPYECMAIFTIKNNKLERIKEVPFSKEKEDIQRVVELNLKNVLGLEFVKSEFSLGNLRIDTLAFDEEAQSFVIIEYKKDKNFSVIDQGYAYLALLLNHKSDFILEYTESKGKSLKRDDIDWSQSKVIFISPEFTTYQRKAIEFKDLPMELWEISKYENGTILLNQLKVPETNASVEEVSPKNEIVRKVSREVKLYSEDHHLDGKPEEIKQLYSELKERILNLGENIEIRPRKCYVGFIANTNFVDMNLTKKQLWLWFNMKKGELDDPRKISDDCSSRGHWGNGDYEVRIKPGDDLDYLMTLIKQSYKKNST